ncbi:SnoaL-like domain-containing protein [Mycena sanguinolenta]|uniref:SnoaL-like domain-containing protein n=1 Tax=Mycena sanguinolenta TaxID=230812 RepID=A0A8H6YTP7_9AGAR|nr:SnoaL-like domain-containing protein [Mycena sanguinolenta]
MRLPAFLTVLLYVAHTSLAALAPPFPSINLTSTTPISPFDLPALLPVPSQPDVSASELIRTTLGHYPLSIDGKNFGALALVFAADAVANYSAPLGVLTPLTTIQAVLASSLEKVTTQHALSTQVIEVLSESEAFSVTYYTATHFGMGVYEGEIAVAYGQYQDYWVLQHESWKIQTRNLVYMGATDWEFLDLHLDAFKFSRDLVTAVS